MVKHFSSTIANRKNCNSALEKHLCLPGIQLEQDHDGTTIVVVCKSLKLVLRTKRGTIVCYHEFDMRQFLAKDDWKTVGGFEAILRDTQRLTLVFQNEEKLNGEHGPVAWNSLHDSLLRATMTFINNELWSSDKEMMHLTLSEVNVNSFSEAGKHSKREHWLNAKGCFSTIIRKLLLLMTILIFVRTYQIGKEIC